jgi:C_GCAxxG_C_C family probable redox protein
MEVFMDKEKMMQNAYDNGFKYERDYRGCAQCTIAAIQDALGIRNDYVYKAGSGLAGGLGECIDGSCGGYSGGAMMISLLFGRTRREEGSKKGREDKYVSFALTSILHDKYVEKYGSTVCAGVQKKVFGRSFNLRNDDEKQLFREAGAHEDDDKCCAAVGDGARWTVEIILAEMGKRGLTIEDFKDLVYIEDEKVK